MRDRKKSSLRIFGWGLLGDAVIFIAALAIFAMFALTSFFNAYMLAFVLVILFLGIADVLNRRLKSKN